MSDAQELKAAADEVVRYCDPLSWRDEVPNFPTRAFWLVIDHARAAERDQQRLREYVQAEIEAAGATDIKAQNTWQMAARIGAEAVTNFHELWAGDRE